MNAEAIWTANRSSDKRTLLEQLDDMHQLSAQFPASPIETVTKAGNTLCAAIVDDRATVIDHKLYWVPCEVHGRGPLSHRDP